MSSFEIPSEARLRLEQISQSGEIDSNLLNPEAIEHLRERCAKAMRANGMLEIVRVFCDTTPIGSLCGLARQTYRQVFLAKLALKLPETIKRLELPDSILTLYPNLLVRLSNTIAESEEHYDIDAFSRDVGLSLALLLPGAAEDIDLNSGLSFRMFASAALKRGDFNSFSRYLNLGLWRTCYNIHLDSRNLTNFNPEGRAQTYHCAADMMRERKNIAAMFAASWFYDPALLEISPRLSYLRETPLKGGAFFICNGSGEIHIERATRTSKTRRDLYKSGKYVPTCYTLIWPRRNLIAWSDRQRAQ